MTNGNHFDLHSIDNNFLTEPILFTCQKMEAMKFDRAISREEPFHLRSDEVGKADAKILINWTSRNGFANLESTILSTNIHFITIG